MMLNILKTKCHRVLVSHTRSQPNSPPSKDLEYAIRLQVPGGILDVIESKEMKKMSKIFTGGTIQPANLHRKVNDYIQEYKSKKFQMEEEEYTSLKAVQRW